METNGLDRLEVESGYHSAYNAVVQPERVFTVSRYFLRHWLPLLDPALAWLIVALRQRCYWNSQQSWCVVSQEQLGQDLGVDRRTVIRQMKKPYFGWFVQDKRRYRYDQKLGRKVQDRKQYTVFQDDPLTPAHLTGLAAVLKEAGLARLEEMPGEALIEKLEEAAKGAPALEMPEGVDRSVGAVVGYTLGAVVKGDVCGLCDRLQRRITCSGSPYLGTQYFRLKWVPLLGPALGWLVVILRSSCYHNRKTGEERHECTWRKRELAAALGQTRGYVFKNLVKAPHGEAFFSEVASASRWVTYRVVMWQDREPILPGDQVPPNEKYCHLEESERDILSPGNGRYCHLEESEWAILSQQEESQTGDFVTTEKHLLSTPEAPKAQQQKHSAVVVADSLPDNSVTNSLPDDSLREVLVGAGVRQPMLDRLLKQPGLTPQAARAWLGYARRARMSNPVGYAINRMLAGDEAPEDCRAREDVPPVERMWRAREERVARPAYEVAWEEALDYVGRRYAQLRKFPRVDFAPDDKGGGVVRVTMEAMQRAWVENRRAMRVLENAAGMFMEGWRVEMAD